MGLLILSSHLELPGKGSSLMYVLLFRVQMFVCSMLYLTVV